MQSLETEKSNPPQLCGCFLSKLFSSNKINKCLIWPTRVSAERTRTNALAYYHRPFVIHSLHDFNTREVLQVVFYIFSGTIPAPFQILRCSDTTTKSELELFFARVKYWPEHQYLIIGVNRLSSKLQEVLTNTAICFSCPSCFTFLLIPS